MLAPPVAVGVRPVGLGVDVDRVAVDGEVDVHADRAAPLLGDLAEQPGGAGQQGEAAQQLDGQPEVGQRGAADAGAVERQRPAEHLLVDAADRLEQPQVRAAQALLLGDPRSAPGCAGPAPCARGGRGRGRTCRPRASRRTASSASASQPASSVGQSPSRPVEHVVQEAAAVLGDAEEPGAAAEQPGRQRALERVGRGQVGQPGGDRGRREAVVGQRDQHGLEDPGLAGRRAGAWPPARRPARRSRPCPSGRR